jgi:glycerol kinase
VIQTTIQRAGLHAKDLAALGVTNQRETTVVWERATGRPLQRAIVWQDRRTAERCRELPAELIRARTGLVPDPYFSATKLEWILTRSRRHASELAVGTVDTWLAWKLTRGAAHVTDVTNASRTMLLGLETRAWDDDLLALFSVDRALLPRVVPSAGVVGDADLLGATVPLAALVGDQQAALFGQGCFATGEAKATYGTGSFVLANLGGVGGAVPDGLLRTAAAVPPGAAPQDAAEGAVLVSGAALQWLRDGLGVLDSAADSERHAIAVDSSGGVVFVPALTGLGSPHWDPDVRGIISGITRGTTREHLVRAALVAIAHQVADVLEVLPIETGVLRADGGASANGFLMQLQADLSGCLVEVAGETESTALGAAMLAGLAVGVWSSAEEVAALIRRGPRYEPTGRTDVAELRERWRHALRQATAR